MRGYLMIFVDGYKVNSRHTIHVFPSGHVIPDGLMPPTVHPVESMEWFTDGWAVGDNSRNRYCGRMNESKIRRLYDYDEAVSFIYKQQKKRRAETFSLVYTVTGPFRENRHNKVSSLDEIHALDEKMDAEEKLIRTRQDEFAQEYPGLDVLKQMFRLNTAHQLSSLLGFIQSHGMQAALQGMAKSTFYRNLSQLREAGLLPKT